MGVSKQDWKDFQTNVWQGEVQSTYNTLLEHLNGMVNIVQNEEADAFISQASSGSEFREAAIAADHAASSADAATRKLKLEGGQRRFANKHAITISDGTWQAVSQYHMATDLLSTGLVRGLSIELEQVQADPAAMTAIKDGDLGRKLRQESERIKDCFEYADRLVKELAAIEKIGVV